MKLQEIQDRLKSDDEEVRRSALHALRNIGLTDSLPLFFNAMGDESWRVRKDSVEAFVRASPDESAVVKLLELLRNEENAGLRNSAAEAVTRLGAMSVAPLVKMVNDPDPDVRKFVLDLMGAIGSPDFLQPLLIALKDPDVNVSSSAAEHLGSSGDSAVMPHLVQAIIFNQDILFRFSAFGALAALAKPFALPDEVLKLADQEILCKAVYDCLGSISDENSIPLLINGLRNKHKNVRSAALKSIYRIYSRASVAVRQKINDNFRSMIDDEMISGILNLFNIQDPLLTEALICCSLLTSDIRFVPILIASFADERFTEAAFKSLKGFGAVGFSCMTDHYPTANENARSAICTLIGESGCYSHADIITAALKDNSSRVRSSAVTTVAKLGMTSLIPDLVGLTDDPDSGVSTAAVRSLQTLALIDRADIIEIASRFSRSEISRHRLHSTLLFASLGELERLQMLAKDEDAIVRRAAVAAIGGQRIKLSGKMLLMALVDENPEVRIAAADSLGEVADTSTLFALERALEDEDVWVKCAVLKAIFKIDQDQALSIIKREYSTAEGLFMISCLQLLQEDGGGDAEVIINSCLASPDPDIARQASISLAKFISNNKSPGCS